MSQNNLTYNHGARYLCKPEKWGLCESKEKKTPQFFISFSILGQIDPQNPEGQLIEAPQGERVCFWFLTENAIDNMLRDLADMGYDLPGLDGLAMNAGDSFDFAKLELTFTCLHEQYNGKWQERFRYGQGGGFSPILLDPKEVAKLNAQFGSRFQKLPQFKGAARQRNGTQAQRPANTAMRPRQDDSIPF